MQTTRLFLFVLFPALLSVLGLTGCTEDSSTVDQDRIYTIYEVFYDTNENQTYAKATFRFGNALGTLLRLSDGADVTFNGDPLLYNPAGFYELKLSGFVNGGTFEYTDLDGETYTNSVSGIRPIAFPASAITLSKATNNDLVWVGDPLGPNGPSNENVGLLVGTELFLALELNATKMIVNPTRLQRLNNGPAIAVLDRYFIRELAEKTSAGGSITGKYRAANKSVEIVN